MIPLREIREKRGLSQAHLAELARVHQTWISKLERGHIHDPSYRVVTRICRVLKVDPESVLEFHAGQ